MEDKFEYQTNSNAIRIQTKLNNLKISQKKSDMTENMCYLVVDGYRGDDGYIDGNIRIFSTRQKAEEHIKKYQDSMKKGRRPGDKFHDYYDKQTIVEIEIE